MKEIYQIHTNSIAAVENIIMGEMYRFTVLTDGLIRLEYREDGVFEDRKTQAVYQRDFETVNFKLVRNGEGIEIITSRLHLYYDEQPFTNRGLWIQVFGSMPTKEVWRYGDKPRNLKGTARTLDEVDGPVALGDGLMSRQGYSILDDSTSLIIREDGWVEPRAAGGKDLYFFGYGHDFRECLKAFYHLCGKTPMLPKFALGNWWSRYYKYTEESYLELMDKFEENRLPFTVAVIDMDWHLVDVDPKYGSGWTGYTWNEAYFPNPERFLNCLKERGMHTTLNVHPADGVRGFEKPYADMAKALGVNEEAEEPILFDASSIEFMNAYFKYLHHPLEEQGVDFWWVDWQQGKDSKIAGLDPLWILNYFHFLDSMRNGKRPMTFSRYAGPGSHRYPVGFSGDSITTWESLDFQPYFTANASNIGYGWWSHDIGGHMRGYQDNEMMARWTWSGIFSPIMRLHCSSSIFNGKEPWRYGIETEAVMGEALRLRHRMIPYLYTMNYRSYQEDLPLIQPMYYEHPEDSRAYEVPNQYYFGSALLAVPVTTKRVPKLHMASVRAFLPEGLWHDIVTGQIYRGGRIIDLYRKIDSIPVLAKAGAILPFTDEIYGTDASNNPHSLHIYIYGGADGTFTLYEDDNTTCDYEKGSCAKTSMDFSDKKAFVIHPVNGDVSLIPGERSYRLEFAGYKSGTELSVYLDEDIMEGITCEYDDRKRNLLVTVPGVPVTKELTIEFSKVVLDLKNNKEELVFAFLNQAEIEFDLKDAIYQLVCKTKDVGILLSGLTAMHLDADLMGILTELISA